MLKIISHRGNLSGPNCSLENNPIQIDKVLKLGFDVEIDLHFHDNDYYLGHDGPQYLIDKYWLLNRKNNLWVHLKAIELADFAVVRELNYFWHENDKFTLTSRGIPWCYPGVYLKHGVSVVLTDEFITKDIFGVCTDYPLKLRNFK